MASEQEQTPTQSKTPERMSSENTMENRNNDGGLHEGLIVTEEGPETHSDLEYDVGGDYTPLGSSSDDPEKDRNYKEYKRLEKEIYFQNSTIEAIKNEIQNILRKSCPDTSERTQLKDLHDCMEQETHKLHYLTKKAMQLQNFGSHRRYKEIELATTFGEEQMSPIVKTCDNMQAQTSQAANTKRKPRRSFRWRVSGGDTTTSEKSCSYQDESDRCESEEQKLMSEILATLQTCNSCNNCDIKKCQNKAHLNKEGTMENLKEKINCMQKTMDKLNEEICRRGGNQKCHQGKHKSHSHTTSSSAKAQQFDNLKDNYMYLLQEFSKKEAELKDISKRLKNSCGSAGGLNADTSEIHLLKNRINDLKEEQIEFKCLMREQSSQLEDYRNKYLTAQQKVEEQCTIIDKLNMNNKRIEKQINLEIKEIRCKFQEKLNELLQYPKLLENEQIKVAKLCKEKEKLESKLVVVCKELKSHKNKSQNLEGGGDDSKPQLQRCQQELAQTKKTVEEIQRQRDLFSEKLRVTQEDLDCLRSESAKIIARLKETSGLIKQQQQEQINRLEKQLAQCRATSCISVSDRECVIREMQGQLSTLSYSFDAAQKQIKTLRNHIAYMSNENCFPAKS